MDFSLQKPVNDFNAKHCALEIQKLLPVKEKTRNNAPFQLYKVALETGRKHQIRAIFSFFQSPIVGDEKYGSRTELKDKILLFAHHLEFNNLPSPLTYLNKKTFAVSGLKKQLVK